MSIAPFTYIKYRPDREDHLLLATLVTLLRESRNSVSHAPNLSEDIYLDPSLSGWTLEELNDEKVEPGDDIIWDEDSDPLKDRPWDNPRQKGMLLLGLYIASPSPKSSRKIILFPNAIELVVQRNPEFLKAFDGDTSEKRIIEARDALLRVVLLHEMGHWFTLDPNIHGDRLSLTYDLREKVDTKALSAGKHSGAELWETLAQLCTWLALRELAKSESQADRAKKLLRAMLLIADPAATYHYQLFWFWLFISGVPTPSDLRRSVQKNPDEMKLAIDRLVNWATGTECVQPKPANLISAFVNPAGLDETNRLGFDDRCSGYPEASLCLWERWKDEYHQGTRKLGENRKGLSDI